MKWNLPVLKINDCSQIRNYSIIIVYLLWGTVTCSFLERPGCRKTFIYVHVRWTFAMLLLVSAYDEQWKIFIYMNLNERIWTFFIYMKMYRNIFVFVFVLWRIDVRFGKYFLWSCVFRVFVRLCRIQKVSKWRIFLKNLRSGFLKMKLEFFQGSFFKYFKYFRYDFRLANLKFLSRHPVNRRCVFIF